MNTFNHEELGDLVEGFKKLVSQKGEYSEILPIEADGRVSTEKRISDDKIPFLSLIYTCGFTILDEKGKQRSPKGLEVDRFYALLRAVQERSPQLKVVIEEDQKERRWIKYTVATK